MKRWHALEQMLAATVEARQWLDNTTFAQVAAGKMRPKPSEFSSPDPPTFWAAMERIMVKNRETQEGQPFEDRQLEVQLIDIERLVELIEWFEDRGPPDNPHDG